MEHPEAGAYATAEYTANSGQMSFSPFAQLNHGESQASVDADFEAHESAGQLLAIRLQIRSFSANGRSLSPTKHLKMSEHKQGR